MKNLNLRKMSCLMMVVMLLMVFLVTPAYASGPDATTPTGTAPATTGSNTGTKVWFNHWGWNFKVCIYHCQIQIHIGCIDEIIFAFDPEQGQVNAQQCAVTGRGKAGMFVIYEHCCATNAE